MSGAEKWDGTILCTETLTCFIKSPRLVVTFGETPSEGDWCFHQVLKTHILPGRDSYADRQPLKRQGSRRPLGSPCVLLCPPCCRGRCISKNSLSWKDPHSFWASSYHIYPWLWIIWGQNTHSPVTASESEGWLVLNVKEKIARWLFYPSHKFIFWEKTRWFSFIHSAYIAFMSYVRYFFPYEYCDFLFINISRVS